MSKVIWVVGGIIVAIGLGYLASRVGGIAVRGVRDGTPVTLMVSEPIVPGVVTQVTWNAPEGDGAVAVHVRTASGDAVIGTSQLAAGQANVQFPCEASGETSVSLQFLLETGQQQVLAHRTVSVLPPGPDCLR